MGDPEDRQIFGSPSSSTQRAMCFGNSMTRADTHLYITYAPRSVAELNREIQREKSKVHQTFNTEAFQKTKITQLMR